MSYEAKGWLFAWIYRSATVWERYERNELRMNTIKTALHLISGARIGRKDSILFRMELLTNFLFKIF